jgi:hypothetical protein
VTAPAREQTVDQIRTELDELTATGPSFIDSSPLHNVDLWNQAEQRWHDDKVLDLVVALARRQLLESPPAERAQRTRHLRTTLEKAFERNLELGPFQPYEGWYVGSGEWTGGVIHFRDLHDERMKSWATQLGRDYTPLPPFTVWVAPW